MLTRRENTPVSRRDEKGLKPCHKRGRTHLPRLFAVSRFRRASQVPPLCRTRATFHEDDELLLLVVPNRNEVQNPARGTELPQTVFLKPWTASLFYQCNAVTIRRAPHPIVNHVERFRESVARDEP